MNRILRWLGGIAGVLILGALGSGLWEKVLSPLLSAASAALVGTISRFSRTYEDSIYALAAKGAPSSAALFGDLLILLVMMLALICFTTPSVRRIFVEVMALTERSYRARLAMNLNSLLCLALVASTLVSVSKLTVASQIESRTLRSMDILRPMIGEPSYIRFRANFYSMGTEQDFATLKSLLDAQAQRYKISIPIDEPL